MSKAFHWVRFVVVTVVAWMCVSGGGAFGATLGDFEALMPDPVRRVVGKLADLQDQKMEKGWLSASGSLFNQSATVYLYWPDKKDLDKAPIVIVPLMELNAKDVFDALFKVPSELDVGLKAPILFWLPERFGVADLERVKLPGDVPARARDDTGLPETVRMNAGLNLYGRVASGFLADVLKPVNLDVNGLTAGLTTGKDAKGVAVYVTSLIMTKEWKNPFGLAETTVTGATVRVTKEKVKQSKTVETWGTATIKDKPYTVYLQRGSLSETLAFDAKDASLKQFFDLADVVSGTLGLPKIPFPSGLPLDKVTLRNDHFVSQLDAASPPKFDKMMFMGSKGVSSDDPKLYINSSAYVFNWQAGRGYIKAFKDGVNGDFALSLPNLGPIKPSSANFYLNVDTSGKNQEMGIKVKAPVFADLDLKASSSGLSLVAAPSCPLRPFGFTADVTDLTKPDFPIQPKFDDCFSNTLHDLVDGGEDAYNETKEFVDEAAKDTAKTAKVLYDAAAANAEKYASDLASAWGTELGKLGATRDAAKAANDAVNFASETLTSLGNTITAAGEEINQLSSKIENLLKQVWSAVSGELKKAKTDMANSIAKRDDARTQQPAAEARLAEAKKIAEKKTLEAAQFPSPYVVQSVAAAREPLMAASAQARVQDGILRSVGTLGDDLKKASAGSRKAFFAKAGTADNTIAKRLADARTASENQFRTYKTMADLVRAGGDAASGDLLAGAKKELISRALAAKLSADTEQLLENEVSALPTMSNDKWVSVVLREDQADPRRCLTIIADKGLWAWDACGGRIDQQFMFLASGPVLARQEWVDKGTRYCNFLTDSMIWVRPVGPGSSCVALSQDPKAVVPRLFHDPIDGLMRFLPRAAGSSPCLRSDENGNLARINCPGPKDKVPGARWTLIDPAQSQQPKTVAAIRTVSAGEPPQRDTAPRSVTNLAPLKLKPLKQK